MAFPFAPLAPLRASPDFEPVTAWHPMLVALLEAYLPAGYELLPEFLLSRLPLMVVADRMSTAFVKRIEKLGGSLTRLADGLWTGTLMGCALHGVETGKAYRRGRSERLLYAFSRAFLRHPAGLAPLEQEEDLVYRSLYQQVEQFRRSRGEFAMKSLEELQKAADEYTAEVLRKMPLERRLAGLTPEQRLSGLAPEQRLSGLTPEQLAALLDQLPPALLATAAKKRAS